MFNAMNVRSIDTVVVGGGQAGLAISYYLKQEGREHVVLEKASAVANAWRNQRWGSFTLVTPNFQVRMPGAEYKGKDLYAFMSLAEVVQYFDDYVERFKLPVHCGVEVFRRGRVGGRDGAAARMGIKRTTLISRMKKLGIDRARYREPASGTPA